MHVENNKFILFKDLTQHGSLRILSAVLGILSGLPKMLSCVYKFLASSLRTSLFKPAVSIRNIRNFPVLNVLRYGLFLYIYNISYNTSVHQIPSS